MQFNGLEQGRQIIKNAIKEMPKLPGIYQMINQDGAVLYVGKAKNLPKRVISYTRDDLPNRLLRMVSQVKSVAIIEASSESEALLIEANLIKKLQPKFNILFKDDKSYPYIKITTNHDFPQLTKFRGKKLEGGKFYGPFASVYDVDSAIATLQKIFLLRNCTDNYFSNRSRPCLQYQIKRCSAPCVNKVSQESYTDSLKKAQLILNGKFNEVQTELAQEMEAFSHNMQYEEAAWVRDKIKSLSYIQAKSSSVEIGISDADIIIIAEDKGTICIKLFLYRAGYNCGSKILFPKNTDEIEKHEILAKFLGMHYQGNPAPKEIIINQNIESQIEIAGALSSLSKHKVTINCPQRGSKRQLIDGLKEQVARDIKAYNSKISTTLNVMSELQELVGIEDKIERIEIYDNSHIMGKYAVGAMVVAGVNGFEKNEYRTYNVTSSKQVKITGGDDYHMMAEVIERRLKRIKTEPHKAPSLMIIDGGKGHMNIVYKTMKKMNLFVPFICMSKGADRNAGRENFHIPDKEIFTLDKDSNLMRYLQILRDEAHNHAISSHRHKRGKSVSKSILDTVPGIGEKRKKSLLHFFGSVENIVAASKQELQKVEGINETIAEKIYRWLH